VQTFQAFEKENALNPDKYVKEKDSLENPTTPQELRADIYENMKKEEQIKSLIPESVCVSMFQINCKDIRNFYAGKFQQIVEKEIKLIQQKAKDETGKIAAKFMEITHKISSVPKNIDELTETKKVISEIGPTIEKLKREIDDCMKVYSILDEFNVELTGLEFNNKWDLFKAPKNVQKVIESQSEVLNKLKEQMLKQMELEQEEFDETLDNLDMMIGGFGAFDNIDKYAEYAQNVDNIDSKLMESEENARLFNQREFLVGKEMRDYTRIAQMKKDFQPYLNLWRTTRTWYESESGWRNCAWEKLNAEDLENTFEQCLKTINQTFRFFRDRDMPKVFNITELMKKKIDAFKPIVPLAVALRKDGMKDRHWKQISDETKIEVYPDEDFCLQKIIDMGLTEHVSICDEVGEKAAKEHHIEKSLVKMKKEWEGLIFLTPKFKNTTTCTIGGFDDAMGILDEHIVTAQAMLFSPFKKPFEEEIEKWCATLGTVSDTLDEWIKCQKSWMYLQPIFDSPDIMKQLPTETKRFKGVDNKWRFTMNQCQEDPSILVNCSRDGLKDNFLESNKNLDIVQKGLADYLEKKRSNFARFYFLSNDELLEILSQTKEVRKVRSHLRKVFEAMADLTFQMDDTMTNMISAEGENIAFTRRVDPKDRNVEFWMGDVERQMTASVRHVCEHGIHDYLEKERNQWVTIHPGQVVLNASQVHWTSDVEKALDEGGHEGIKVYLAELEQQLSGTVMLVRQKLSKLAKISVNALIVIDVHAKDVIAELVNLNISDKAAFEWVKQLRYYWYTAEGDELEQMWCKCVATVFPYGYEYLGNTGRLVITPLTDKCYMTLMGALQLNLGGAPAGPAGTGKTESTKDLAKALAKHCVVFNCSDDMDHIMVAKFFKGLAASGAWCCFDEFNRINIEVLSVIAQFLLQLFGAKARLEPEIIFEGSHIKMRPTFCVFITMNPGYAGRNELPDNLKALFRPVAMMVPDYALIGEIMLYSFGYLKGRVLAQKMVTTFKLASE
jgi:dynein heavy chain